MTIVLIHRLSQYVISKEETFEDYAEKNIRHYTTNGKLWPKLIITTNQRKRFR